MSEPLIERVRRAIEHIAAENEIEIERIVVYGSQTREDHHEGSDLDIVLVSPDWKEIKLLRSPGTLRHRVALRRPSIGRYRSHRRSSNDAHAKSTTLFEPPSRPALRSNRRKPNRSQQTPRIRE
jgi:predicted nucleotidyltransferase